MSIKVADAPRAPGITEYPFPQMLEKLVRHPKKNMDGDPSVFILHIEYQMYAVDVYGKRHYEPVIRDIDIKDFIEHAIEHANNGDPTLLSAMAGDEAAIASLIAEDLGTTSEIV